jgi:hypothetical protein
MISASLAVANSHLIFKGPLERELPQDGGDDQPLLGISA